jgi:hypothetical protein
MKKKYVVLIAVLLVLSCNKKETKAEKSKILDVSDEVVLGGDKDEDGCLASSGYTWSKLNKECVRIFTGMQLLPYEQTENETDAVLATYVLFDEKKDNAELFLPNQNESVVLKKAGDGQPWTNGEWQLIAWKGFVLKKDGKILYAGDGQIGSTVTGSDDSEEIPVTE